MKNSCLDLLPQSANAIIRDTQMKKQIVNLILYFTKTMIEALKEFYLRKNYHHFDPHVGETACQIRAYCFLELSNKKYTQKKITNRLDKLTQIYEALISTLPNYPFHNNGSTISDWIFKVNAYFKISPTELFLTQCYFLTKFKKKSSNSDFKIDCEIISKTLAISRKLSKKVVRAIQLSIANYSCKKIALLLDKLKISKLEKQIFISLIKHDDDDRLVLPCYFFTKILLRDLLFQRLPILLISHRKGRAYKKRSFLFYDHDLNPKRFVLVSESNLNPQIL